MLKLKDIKKDYVTGDTKVAALRGVSLEFRANEFVSILGASGCGKTTLLNIIGGLDKYTSGDLVIRGKSTKNYTDRDWDVYRNHRIGFVFQSYNLIPHQTVLGNVELALTIAGLSKTERRKRAEDALKRVGLEEQMNKRPNQLSGGQMQRVAIARALVNNPEILLADEPTGALDTKTSIQIMELIREIAGERLVIMVTHNPELAEKYSSRIVRLSDGLVISDSNPYDSSIERNDVYQKLVKKGWTAEKLLQWKKQKDRAEKKKTEKAAMSFATALGLSARNLKAKKGRTLVTSFAGSIGIISVCLVLALSNGFNNYIVKTEEDMLSYYPIEVTETSIDVQAILEGMSSTKDMPKLSELKDKVYVNSFLTKMAKGMTVTNNISTEYIDYIEAMDESYYYAIHYDYGQTLSDNLFTGVTTGVTQQLAKDEVMSLTTLKAFYTEELTANAGSEYGKMAPLVNYLGSVVNVMPGTRDVSDKRYGEYVQEQYEVFGEFPDAANEAVFVVGGNNDVTDLVLAQLGYLTEYEFLSLFENKTEADKNDYLSVPFSEICEKEFVLYDNDQVYNPVPQPAQYAFEYNGNRTDLSTQEGGQKIKITGVLRLKKGYTYGCLATGLNLTEQLVEEYVIRNKTSQLATHIRQNKMDVPYGGQTVSVYLSPAEHLNAYFMKSEQTGMYLTTDPTAALRVIGGVDMPSRIAFYPKDFETKDDMMAYLEAWNKTHAEEDKIAYTDTVGTMMKMVQTILNAVTYVLVAFTAISLVVSSVMIGIITYVSVVERTKEIGVLRSLGARKKDIKNLFNAETFIIGLASGVFGALAAYLITFIINAILTPLTGIAGLASLPLGSAIAMVVISITLTLISGLIPAQSAATKDPVIALRTE